MLLEEIHPCKWNLSVPSWVSHVSRCRTPKLLCPSYSFYDPFLRILSETLKSLYLTLPVRNMSKKICSASISMPFRIFGPESGISIWPFAHLVSRRMHVMPKPRWDEWSSYVVTDIAPLDTVYTPRKLTTGTWKWWFPKPESPFFEGSIFRWTSR